MALSSVDMDYATNELHKTIKAFTAASEKHSCRMLWLTVVIAFLTLVMLAAVIVQVVIILRGSPGT